MEIETESSLKDGSFSTMWECTKILNLIKVNLAAEPLLKNVSSQSTDRDTLLQTWRIERSLNEAFTNKALLKDTASK